MLTTWGARSRDQWSPRSWYARAIREGLVNVTYTDNCYVQARGGEEAEPASTFLEVEISRQRGGGHGHGQGQPGGGTPMRIPLS